MTFSDDFSLTTTNTEIEEATSSSPRHQRSHIKTGCDRAFSVNFRSGVDGNWNAILDVEETSTRLLGNFEAPRVNISEPTRVV